MRGQRRRANTRAYFPGKRHIKTIGLTDFGLRLLETAKRHHKRSEGDIVEQLLRRHVASLSFAAPDDAPAGDLVKEGA